MKGEEKEGSEDEEGDRLLEVPFDPGEGFDYNVGDLGNPQGWKFQDKIGTFTGKEPGR